MHNSETLCLDMVKKVKTGLGTPQRINQALDELMSKARKEYDEDGDMDVYEKQKFVVSIVCKSVEIAMQ